MSSCRLIVSREARCLEWTKGVRCRQGKIRQGVTEDTILWKDKNEYVIGDVMRAFTVRLLIVK